MLPVKYNCMVLILHKGRDFPTHSKLASKQKLIVHEYDTAIHFGIHNK